MSKISLAPHIEVVEGLSLNISLVIRVFHIIVGLNVGGAELMLKRLVESNRKSSIYRHSVISLTDLGKIGLQLQALGIEVRVLGMQSSLDIPRVLWQLMRIIKKKRPDIIQTWMYHADLIGGLAARLAGNNRVIWGVRTTDVDAGGKRATLWVRKACAWLSLWVPHTIVCAADASRRSHVAIGYDADRMVVVPNGFDIARLVATKVQSDILRAECNFDANTIVIGSLGRFHEVKDHANFVKAAGLLMAHFPAVQFLLVGRDLDTNNKELMSWIAATGYPNRFVLLGQRADVPVCLSIMDILCLHSKTEGFPNVVGEAMAMGVPCVATDVGDARFLMADTGVIVPKEDSVALAEGLKQMLEMTREERSALGQKAKMRIYSEFTMERCRERFEAIYEKVIAEDRV